MSDNPRLNPIIVCVPLSGVAAATIAFLHTDLGGQALTGPSFFSQGAAIVGTDNTNYTTVGVKVGTQAVGLSIGTNPIANGGSGPIAAGGAAVMKSGGQTPAQLALRQWTRGTMTDVAVSKVESGSGLAGAAGSCASIAIIQSAYDPLS